MVRRGPMVRLQVARILIWIDEQYMKGQERVWKGKKWVWKRARTALERGQEQVLKGEKMGSKRYTKRNLAKSKNLERGRMAPWPLSTSFQPFFRCSASFFTRLS